MAFNVHCIFEGSPDEDLPLGPKHLHRGLEHVAVRLPGQVEAEDERGRVVISKF